MQIYRAANRARKIARWQPRAENSLEEEAVARHGVDDARHREHGAE